MAYMITTVNNPYNPSTQFEEWYRYDMARGYGTCGLLSRIVGNFDEVSDNSVEDRTEAAIDSLIRNFGPDFYAKIEI